MAEYERTLLAERMRRGRQAKLRSGQLLPWTRAPYGSMVAWYTDTGQASSLYQVAKRLSEAHMPTPRGGKRWNVASVRGILRSPTSTGVA